MAIAEAPKAHTPAKKRDLVTGYAAIGLGTVDSGCTTFFGYPITPQNEVIEWFARELPARNGVFLQAQSEISAINMVYGASATGTRVITSTASSGWSLMQETLSNMANSEAPCVIVLVQRDGPGESGAQTSQMDYYSAKGGGHGGYKNIVLTPGDVRETYELVQLAFHLADKYRNPVIVLLDAYIIRLMEPVTLERLDFGPLPEKNWAVVGLGKHPGTPRRPFCPSNGAFFREIFPNYLQFLAHLNDKYEKMRSEVRFKRTGAEDADLILVAFGYVSRVCQEVLREAHHEGLKIGMIRPLTVWPFPEEAVIAEAARGARFLVVEDNLGQMVDDVRAIVPDKSKVFLHGIANRHVPTPSGMIMPDRVLAQAREILGGEQPS